MMTTCSGLTVESAGRKFADDSVDVNCSPSDNKLEELSNVSTNPSKV